jgi:predicted Zn-ribbon and HTH transcriptional regulator
MPRADSNLAAYGPCLATTYARLELSGLPSPDSPGFAGVLMELVVLKKDTYGQTVFPDSSSSLQVFSSLNGARGANDASVSFLGSIFSGFENGRAHFSIGVKPTFSSLSELEGRTALLRQPFLYISGTDVATGAAMQTDVLQVHLSTLNRSACRRGSVLVRDSTDTLPTPGACVLCSPGKYSVKALTGVCLVCPPSATCFNGAPPLFGASKVAGALELELSNDGDDAKKSAIAAKLGVELWQILLPSQGAQRRNARSISFELVADKTLMTALAERITALGVSLGAIQAVGDLAAEGEVWEEVAGTYILRSCPSGSQLINTTDGVNLDVAAQKCKSCGVTTYIIDQLHECKKCPKGAGNPSVCQLFPSILFFRKSRCNDMYLCILYYLSLSLCLSRVLIFYHYPVSS